jgi:alkylation response protein AidB-like acyl-CoA dehydrogenase
MPTYQAPVRDMRFVLHEMLQIERFSNLPGFADAPRDVVDQILEEGAKFTEEVLHPLNQVGDREGCTRLQDGTVLTPTGFKDAFRQLVDAGWPLLSANPEYGGQGLPHILNLAFNEMVSSANMAFGMYPGLTHGAYAAIETGGTPEQKALYLPKMASCQWTGTMNLTEPHCGTDLGLLRTKAVPQGDGSYLITGQKIFISAGEHDMAENIIHLVLARIEGAPEGVKGISLFVVPKFIPDAEGNPGERNSLSCGKLEEKMGIHGNATAVMNYDGARGWLVGEAHKGLRVMFVMMNEARLGVGLQGLAQAEIAYQNAAAYAKDRIQGRSISGVKAPEKAADPIIVHPDVRRMLMNAKAFNEGARAFMFWTGLYGDLLHKSPDAAERQKADDYMALMTPVLKGFLTDKGFDYAVQMQQVFGGHGYVEEWGMSQFVRDARIAMIYEGANGVQALDLVGRKLAMQGGRPIQTFFAEIDAFIAENEAAGGTLEPFLVGLKSAKAQLMDATFWLMGQGMSDPDQAGAASTDYLHLFGLTALAYMWAMMAKAALPNLGGSDTFYDTKIKTGRYFIDRVLPETAAHLARLKAGKESLMALDAAAF